MGNNSNNDPKPNKKVINNNLKAKTNEINIYSNSKNEIIEKENSMEKEAMINQIKIKNDKNNIINPKIQIIKRIENYSSSLTQKDERCITSFTILRNNKILLTFKGGIIHIYEFLYSDDKKDLILNDFLRLEEEEYCFNYGIELKNGDLAICSEDSTIKIIKIFLDEEDKIKFMKNKINVINKESNIKDKKHELIQKIVLDDPLYIIKEFEKGELVVGSWQFIFIFVKVPSINKYELINTLLIGERTFSLIELNPGEILSSQNEPKKLTIYKINDIKFTEINNIESNENPNIICKYNNQNEIVFVAHNKGINIVSIINKCLIKNIELKEIITSLCPYITPIKKNGDDKFTLLCGVKSRIFYQKVNFNYNFIQIGFNLDNKSQNEGNINNQKIIYSYHISLKKKAHLNEIKQIENIIYSKNNILDKNKEQQIIFSMGSEDKTLKIWELDN